MEEIINYEPFLDKDKKIDEMEGHAVLLNISQIEYLRFLNSWGICFWDQGFFNMKNSEVFGEIMKFYELYWDDNDLTQSELEEHYKLKKMLCWLF